MDTGINLFWNSEKDCEGDGLLATLIFEVKENAEPKEYTLSARVNEVLNENFENLDLAVVDGKITVSDFVYGDASGDGSVNGSDVILLRMYMANYDYTVGMSTVAVYEGADADGDGSVGTTDVLLVRKYMANYDYTTGTSSVVLGPKE